VDLPKKQGVLDTAEKAAYIQLESEGLSLFTELPREPVWKTARRIYVACFGGAKAAIRGLLASF